MLRSVQPRALSSNRPHGRPARLARHSVDLGPTLTWRPPGGLPRAVAPVLPLTFPCHRGASLQSPDVGEWATRRTPISLPLFPRHQLGRATKKGRAHRRPALETPSTRGSSVASTPHLNTPHLRAMPPSAHRSLLTCRLSIESGLSYRSAARGAVAQAGRRVSRETSRANVSMSLCHLPNSRPSPLRGRPDTVPIPTAPRPMTSPTLNNPAPQSEVPFTQVCFT